MPSKTKRVSCETGRPVLTETGVRWKYPVHQPQVMINSPVNHLHIHGVEPLRRSFNTPRVIVLFPVGYVNQHVFIETEHDLHNTEALNVK